MVKCIRLTKSKDSEISLSVVIVVMAEVMFNLEAGNGAE
jgi:hypothetical protein